VGYIALMGGMRNASINLKVRYHSEDLDVDGKIISEWTLGK
jgi:hypothetical protein